MSENYAAEEESFTSPSSGFDQQIVIVCEEHTSQIAGTVE